MLTVPKIIETLGGPTKVGRICGFTRNPGARGHDLKARNSIPARYWPFIVAEASRQGKTDITLEVLAALHARPASKDVEPMERRAS